MRFLSGFAGWFFYFSTGKGQIKQATVAKSLRFQHLIKKTWWWTNLLLELDPRGFLKFKKCNLLWFTQGNCYQNKMSDQNKVNLSSSLEFSHFRTLQTTLMLYFFQFFCIIQWSVHFIIKLTLNIHAGTSSQSGNLLMIGYCDRIHPDSFICLDHLNIFRQMCCIGAFNIQLFRSLLTFDSIDHLRRPEMLRVCL